MLHFAVISDLYVEPFFFKTWLAFTQTNKNVTLKQNSEKSGSENRQNDLVVSSVPGITFSFPQMSVGWNLLMTADEDLSTAKAAMVSRDLMPWFILHTFQGCSKTSVVWAVLRGYAGAINASNSCIHTFLVGASVGFVW